MLVTDIQYAHNDDLNVVLAGISWVPQGSENTEAGFATHSAIPVLELYRDDVETREDKLIADTLARSSGVSVPAEVLPGELVCIDHVIRRESALKEPEQAKAYQNARTVSIGVAKLAQKDGKMVVWRPKGFNDTTALILEDGDGNEN